MTSENPCVRCGYCCKYMMVIIVSDPDKGISEDNIEFKDGDGEPCKYLQGEVGSHVCAIHDRSWYPDTPCANYHCKNGIGNYILAREGVTCG